MKKINNNLPRGGAEWGRALRRFLSDNIVPIMFVLICAYCIPRADLSWNYLLNEGMTRLGRNAFLILSLLIPVMAGMGMNFGMTLGAMAGQIGLIFAADWQVWGIPGLILAAIISIPISVLLGIMIGKLLNRAAGRFSLPCTTPVSMRSRRATSQNRLPATAKSGIRSTPQPA